MRNYDYIKLKPYKASELDISEEDMWVLNFEENHNLKVNTFTKNIFTYFDGKHSLCEIVEQLKQEKISVTEQDLMEFVESTLVKHNLIEGLQGKRQIRFTLTLHIPLIEARRLYHLFDWLGKLYRKNIVCCLLVFCGLVQIYSICSGGLEQYFIYKKQNLSSVVVLILFLIGTVLHEFGHAAAARYYHGEVGKMGIGIYLFMPVAYTDLSGIWDMDRKKRVVINLGGFYFSLLYGTALILIGEIIQNSNFILANVIIMMTMLMNANPLLRMDGYWVLCDAFGIVNVNKKMSELFLYWFRKLFGMQAEFPLEQGTHHKTIYYVYFMCFTVCNILFFVVGITGIIRFFK